MILVGIPAEAKPFMADVTKTGKNPQLANIERLDKFKSRAKIPGNSRESVPPRIR
jgi:hypothetical protein